MAKIVEFNNTIVNITMNNDKHYEGFLRNINYTTKNIEISTVDKVFNISFDDLYMAKQFLIELKKVNARKFINKNKLKW